MAANNTNKKNFWQKMRDWKPEQKKIFIFILLGILAAVFFVFIFQNFQHKLGKLNQFNLLKPTNPPALDNSFKQSWQEAVETTQELKELEEILNQMEKEMEEATSNTSTFDKDTATTSQE